MLTVVFPVYAQGIDQKVDQASKRELEVKIDIVGVDQQLENQVRGSLGEPLSTEPAMLAAFRRRAPEKVRSALAAVGYYEPQIEVQTRSSAEEWRLMVMIDPGQPVRLRWVDVQISGEASSDPQFSAIESRLPLSQGEVLNHGDYETARRMIANLALERGYFDGRFTRHRVEVYPQEHAADVILRYYSGQRYHFGEVRFADSPLADEFLQRMVQFEPGDPYSGQLVGRLNRVLRDSGYFHEVRVRPLPQEGQQGQQGNQGQQSNGQQLVPIEVGLEPRARHEITTGVGFTTDWGARVRLGWKRPWFNPWGHSMGADVEVAQRRQSISGRYRIPLRDPLRTSLEFQLGAQQQDVADIDLQQLSAAVRHRHRLTSGWQQVLSLRADWESFRIDQQRRITQLLLPGVSWSKTRSRGGLDPQWGDRQMLSIEATEKWLSSDIAIYRARLGSRWLRTLGERNRLLFRAELGAMTSDDFERVPTSLRFYAGGDQSIRGYQFQSLGPERDGTVIGGSFLALASLEYGYQITPRWRPAVFVDAGNALEDFNDLNESRKIGVGTGLRWSSPIGPVRLDLAFPFDEDDEGIDNWRIHFSMGSDL